MPRRDDSFTLYDLRIEVVRGRRKLVYGFAIDREAPTRELTARGKWVRLAIAP